MADRRWYLEKSDGTGRRHDFYELILLAREVTVRWGRIGAEGQEYLRRFELVQDAYTFALARVEQKRRAGYRSARPGARPPAAPPPPPDPRQVDLEELLHRDERLPPCRRRRRRIRLLDATQIPQARQIHQAVMVSLYLAGWRLYGAVFGPPGTKGFPVCILRRPAARTQPAASTPRSPRTKR